MPPRCAGALLLVALLVWCRLYALAAVPAPPAAVASAQYTGTRPRSTRPQLDIDADVDGGGTAGAAPDADADGGGPRAPTPFRAGLRFAQLFTDNLVLQRDRDFCVWGYAARVGEAVNLTLEGPQGVLCATATTAGRRAGAVAPAWTACCPAVPGGPAEHTLVARTAAELARVRRVLVGDVWMCGGQSNMQFPLKRVQPPPPRDLAGPLVRLLQLPKAKADTPQADIGGAVWLQLNRHNAAHFSAVCLLFGLELLRVLQRNRTLPLGLVANAVSGTIQQTWLPPAAARPCAETPGGCRSVDQPGVCPAPMWFVDAVKPEFNRPGVLYNALVAPLGGLRLTGVLWYQGESNGRDPAVLACLLPRFVGHLRALFADDRLLFLAALLAPYRGGLGVFPVVREAQQRGLTAVPRAALVNILDTGDPRSPFEAIHSRVKDLVALRFAAAAAALHYGRPVPFHGPVCTHAAAEYERGQYRVRVRCGTGNATLSLRPTRGCVACCASAPVEVTGRADPAGPGWVAAAAAATLGGELTATGAGPVEPLRWVRYAYQDYPECLLYDAHGFPADPFLLPMQ